MRVAIQLVKLHPAPCAGSSLSRRKQALALSSGVYKGEV